MSQNNDKSTSYEQFGKELKIEYQKINPVYGDKLNFSVEPHPFLPGKFQGILKDGGIKLYMDPFVLDKDDSGSVYQQFTENNRVMMSDHFSSAPFKDNRIVEAINRAMDNCIGKELSVQKEINNSIDISI